MSKKDKVNDSKETEKVKQKKKKMTANQKRKLVMKIVGWIMAIVMVIGTLATIFAPLLLA